MSEDKNGIVSNENENSTDPIYFKDFDINSSNLKEINDEIDTSLINTGSHIGRKKTNYFFSTQDLLIASILGVMGGFISGSIPFSMLVKTWYPFVGGTQLVSGHHLLWMTLTYGLTGKKRTIFITAIIQGFMNFLFGSSWGILEIGITFYEGFFLFLGFALIQEIKEDNSKLGWAIAGGLGNVSQVPLFWIITGKIYILHWTLFVMAIMFGFLSGVIIAGLLGRLIVQQIKNTGVI